ncbi:hypothetical protein [Pseudoalteromonas viridis]|uniref:PA14 domain-containing protein n=1 Tax=Pseudoalteromonas viridis TaxID=339617 RepID=A0ABX7V749_9GAMM|nr:hypothetical protein [Pseudoalteromonas viridis]QTL34354.1 hypothetical protein J5X90_12380 [Pseudoalteromonas viridis]
MIREVLIVISVMACLMTSPSYAISKPVVDPNGAFEYGPFIAKYYSEDDGTQPGQGNDGTNPDIPAVFVAQEETPYPAIHYAANFNSGGILHGIDPYSFYGVWEGTLKVHESTEIYANIDKSSADVSLYINDVIVPNSNTNTSIKLQVGVGEHAIRVEFHNHSTVAQFNVSFTNYPELTVSTAATKITPLVQPDTKLAYIGTYRSTTLYNETEVSIPKMDGSVLLFLSSYHAINWIIENPYNTEIKGIILNSYTKNSIVRNLENTPIYKVKDLVIRSYNSRVSGIYEDMEKITNRPPDHIWTQISLEDISLPNLELDKAPIEYGPFTAKYYSQEDGHEPLLIAQEQVLYPSITYSGSGPFGIHPHKFYGVWEGTISIPEATNVFANLGNSLRDDIKLIVNGEVIEFNAASSSYPATTSVPLILTEGTHQIKVEYQSHGNVDFIMSFTNYARYPVNQARTEIKPLIKDDTKIINIGTYKANTLYNEIIISIPAMESSIMLFLSSYLSVNWVIDNPYNVEVVGVVVNNLWSGSNVSNVESSRIFNVLDLTLGYQNPTKAIKDIEKITAQVPDYSVRENELDTVVLPNLD